MHHGTEQGSAEGTCGALVQVIGVADENRHRCTLVGDEMESVQSLLRTAECQAGQEFLGGGVTRPERQKDQIAVFVSDAAIGHQVGAFVDPKQRLSG